MPNYTYATYSDALTALGSRLYDPSFQQWTQAELTGYLNEALQTWNALSGFWRNDMVFTLAEGAWWYDLRTVTGTVLPYQATQYGIITQIENHLLEPPTPAAWTGSSQFSLNDLLLALQRRQDDVLGSTGCTATDSLVNAAIGIRTILPDSVIDILRVAWIPTTGFGYSNKILRQSDLWAARAFNPRYTTSAEMPPSNWMQNAEPPPSFDVDSVPPVTGKYDVLTVNSGPAWVAGTDSTIPIPTDWAWVAKWGALFDLLSRESNAKDSARAAYCRKRFEEGMAMLEASPVLLAARVNNIPYAVDSVKNADDFNSRWQAAAEGPPKSIYTAKNLMAIAPAPDAGPYSVTASVVQNAPVGGTYVQVARDDFDSIIDYAHHLAMFKAGGAEFLATVELYQRFQRKASQYNSKLSEMGFFSLSQQEISNVEQMERPRYMDSKELATQ
ncbi:MAG TPA: hypothetical protein VJQ82_02625 [Terriglobales bacterium]|nr:hypothetical protein [Terriglobales bacterium]